MSAAGPRLNSIEPDAATGKTAAMYGQAKSNMGMVPNLFKGLANSPQALEAYLTLDKLIGEGSLSPVEQQLVRMVVSVQNECTYCVAAHTLGLQGAGLSDAQILEVRRGRSDDAKLQALIDFTAKVMDTIGFVSDEELAAVRAAGYTDANIADVMVVITQKTLSNYFNHVHNTVLDLPPAPSLD
ncbi:MAG: carboxymuconolactone decarboxylase family protein [Gammaproteobacteria bacterium]